MHPAEEIILQAIQRGEFDNLAGCGKPLKIPTFPFEEEDMRLAYHILRNAGYTLPWIETRTTILNAINKVRQEIKALHQEATLGMGERKKISAIEDQIQSINSQIRRYNLMVNSGQLQLAPLDIHAELEG